jgi:carbon monoxide dehydrogenase subunit G
MPAAMIADWDPARGVAGEVFWVWLMELAGEFSVPVPVAQAWQVLTDVERIAPCLPGAELTGADGDTYQGQVKIKVGPITAQYRGTASLAS